MIQFVDSHAHLADEAFDADREEVIARARAAGARAIICIGESADVARRAARLAADNSGFVWFTAGVHPHNADLFDPIKDIESIRQFAANGAVAVGECGLDYHYDNSPRLLQRRAFAQQVEIARELSLPVVVHTRDADDDTRAIMQEAASAGVRGVLHCFTASDALATAALEAGWYLSFSGIITFTKWGRDALLKSVPADRLLVESDSPYLAPVPHRGRRNEPAWVSDTVSHLARARGESTADVAQITSRNAAEFFGVALRAVD